MPFSQKIRLLALAIVKQGDRLFISQGFDPIKQQTFYRVMGGGVDFGETSLEALKREFMEEIQAEITNIKYIACLENIFEFNGNPGHEIIQLYECDFVDPTFYEREEIIFNEGERQKKALWVDLEKFRSGEFKIVPENFLDYL